MENLVFSPKNFITKKGNKKGHSFRSLLRDQVQCACSYKPQGGNKFIKPEWLPEHNAGKEYTPSYNITPTDVTPVLVSTSKYRHATAQERVIKPMMWGLIPPWHKGDYKTQKLTTNNCRIENIKESKLYSPLLKNGGRCVIIAEGFYEWQTTNAQAKVKQPYYIHMPQSENIEIDDPETWNNSYDAENGWAGISLLYMAGLYNVWQDGSNTIYSYSVITMESNDSLSWLHHRMPAVLDTEEQIQAWLDIDKVSPDVALSYLRPVTLLRWHPVSTAVNNSRNKADDCNKKVTIEKKHNKQKTLTAWFTPTNKRKSSDNEDSKTNNKRICKYITGFILRNINIIRF